MNLSYLQKISSNPIFIPNVGHLKSPTINEVSLLGQNEYGQNVYNGKINILLVNPKELLSSLYKTDELIVLESLSENAFLIWSLIPELMQLLTDSLSFFFANNEILTFNEKLRSIVISDIDKKVIGEINNDNFDDIINVIKQLNYIEISDCEKVKPKNKTAEKLLAKMQKGEFKKSKKKSADMDLANIISALSVAHNSYNLNNIWSLTIYQLYDQFMRQNIKNQIDVSALKWGAWGNEPFDFELWYKSINN